MSKRLSLYFEPYAWERLNRYLSYLLLSGKPMYELPTMNDLIEGMVVYVSQEITDGLLPAIEFSSFFESLPSKFSKKRFYSKEKDKGRMAFNITEVTEDAINEIRRVDAERKREDNLERFLPDDATDPLVVRACVYYIVTGFHPEFIDQLYFSFLYNIRPSMLGRGRTWGFDYDRMTDQEKVNAEKISWDDSVLEPLFNLEKSPDLPEKDPAAWRWDMVHAYSWLKIEARNTTVVSRGFGFDYKEAFLGYHAMREGIDADLSLPELLTHVANPAKVDGHGGYNPDLSLGSYLDNLYYLQEEQRQRRKNEKEIS